MNSAALTCPGIVVDSLTLRFGERTVFENLSMEIAGGQFVALLGTSGIGKSSLLKILAGVATPTRGSVRATDGGLLPGRIAYMGQTDLLYPWLRVVDNVVLGSRLRSQRPDRARAMHLLERVGLADRARALPMELSGGMRQRTALARTLYEDRPMVLMDEPFSALDTLTRARVQELAAEMLQGRTVLLITHDPMEACRLGHHLFVLSGRPAVLSAPIFVPGRIPRALDDPELLRTQGHLMRVLTAAETE
jgi:putative hydroxymethylpyrimidine transport system ATP-binding protein